MTPRLGLIESNTTGTGRLFATRARERGLEPVLLCSDPGRYPFASEDAVELRVVDTLDEHAVTQACRELGAGGAPLAGVLSSSEYFVATACGVARRLGLPGADAAAVRQCQDKGAQRRLLRAAGVATPGFEVIDLPADAVAAAERLGLPVVVKPVAGSGSLGVALCGDRATVRAHAHRLLGREVNERGMPVPRRVLVEAFVDGAEYSVETLSGQAVAVVRKHLASPPSFMEVGHDFPVPPGPRATALARAAEEAVRVLGVGSGPCHVELRCDGTATRIIEVNPRLAGGFIPELVRAAAGIDLIDAVIAAAVGAPVELAPRCADSAAIRFLAPSYPAVVSDGTAPTGAALTAHPEGVVDARLYRPTGAEVSPGDDFRARVGHVLARAGSPTEASAIAERALSHLGRALIPIEVTT